TRTKVPPKVYKVKRGDTLSEIARAHHVKLSDLRQWNNLKNRSKIRIGQTLKIGSSKASPSKEPLQYHTVKPGEYPGIIAQLYSVSVNDLLRWNNLNKKSVLQVGDKLVIAGKGSVKNTQTAETKPKKNTTLPSTVKHKIAKGETAGEIAERYGVSTRDLLSCNKLTAKSILRVGKTLTVRNPKKGMGQRDHSGDTTLTQAENRVVHKVTAGQNPSTIAKKYGVRVKDLFTWNNWKNKHVLQIGDEVSIYRD
ncbi:MAG: LysM peptidoglycan-binding domain-containing protein, partial [Candidatus Hydrogenedentes bacterium]|nr:LysM peptidoglycan-binding domain-containing protein [Candidatus Hydrogenedentota bacterium]